MLEILASIRDRTASDSPWLGDAALERALAALAALPPRTDSTRRWRILLDVAEHELRLGDERGAIDHFLEAYALLPDLGPSISNDDRLASIFRLGIAFMRLGDRENCGALHSGESCILPIRGAGVHTRTEGSQQAIRYFSEILASTQPTSPLNLKTAWLLNIAYMTLGEYPDGVPEEVRMPEAIFASGQAFPHFENVAPQLGVATVNLSGGAVFDDLDGDGLADVFTTTFDTAVGPRFFHNEGDGTFTDRTSQAGIENLFGGLNLVQGDYDNDGDLDLFILRGAWLYVGGRHPNSLLRNDGEGVFTDVTFAAGLAEVDYPTQAAAWADYDNDGDLDLFVGNEEGDGLGILGDDTPDFEAPCQLFRNDGDGNFTDVAPQAGVAISTYVKGVVWGDYDNDRFPDLYLSILGAPNRLYRNNQDGTFTDLAQELGVSAPIQSFPVWFWDYDNDGNLDLYVSSYRGFGSVALVAASYFGIEVPWELPRLYRGDGRGGFKDVSQAAGLTRLHLPMGSNFGDLDGDGFLDFYLGTGYPDYEAVMPNVLYRNREGRDFVDVTLAAGFGHLQKGHAVAFADFDQDGDLDVFEQMGGAFPGDRFADALFLNPGFGNHWITLHLRGNISNRAAIGARLKMDVIERGGRRRSIHRRVSSGGSFGANALHQTLGIGRAVKIESLEVYWPTSDRTDRYEAVEANRSYRIVEGEARLVTLR
ncbi:MAG: CRTAC1 family protein [Acidobacteriota bacterium]|nr:CRTAC1 family protein [Acidobacteriota bacterium]